MSACFRRLAYLTILFCLPSSQLLAIGAEEALRPAAKAESTAPEVLRKSKAAADGEVQDDTQELLPALLGCIFTPDAARGLALQSQGKQGLHLEGFDPAETQSLTEILSPFISKPVTLRLLDEMAAKAETLLEKTRGTMMRAAFPPQEITSGIVVMTIQPAVLGKIVLRGEPRFGQKFITKSLHAQPGQPIDRDGIAADLDWLNQNPLRNCRAVFTPSDTAGMLDLALQVDAKKPWRIYSGFDNSLSDRLGDWRWFLGAQHGDLWHLDHRLTAQVTAGLDYEALHGGGLTYEIPLPWRHILEFSANYSESQSSRDSGNTFVDQSGKFQRYSMAYSVPMRWHGWQMKWRSGVTFRDQVYLIDASTTSGLTAQSQLGLHGIQVQTGFTAENQDRLGTTRGGLRLLWNPGMEPLSASDADFRALGASGADAWIAELNLVRTLSLKRIGLFSAKLDAQWTDQSLVAADQFAPVIFGRVRGFDEITGYGDNGASLSLEYFTPWKKLSKLGSFRALTFLDGAIVTQRSTHSRIDLLSTGIGARWQLRGISAQCDLGIPLSAPEGTKTDPRARFSMTVSW
jgi:hemolysin activation/secretion protein